MKKIIRITIFILTILLLSQSIVYAVPNTKNKTIKETDEYKYEILKDGTAKLLLYKGKESNVNIPKAINGHKVTVIGKDVFYYYDNFSEKPNLILNNLNISASVKTIETENFEFTNIVNINVDKDNQNYSSLEGVLFNKDQTKILYYPILKKDKEYTLPATVISLSEGIFSGSEFLEEIKLNNQIMSIPENSFEECKKLKNINIPESVISIGRYAFTCCDLLNEVRIPKSVMFIDEYAFSTCAFLSVIFIENNNTVFKPRALGDFNTMNPFESWYNSIFPLNIVGEKGSTAENYCKKYDEYAIFVEKNEYQKFPFLYSTTFRLICIIGVIVLVFAIIVAIALLPVIISRRKEISNNSKKQFR